MSTPRALDLRGCATDDALARLETWLAEYVEDTLRERATHALLADDPDLDVIDAQLAAQRAEAAQNVEQIMLAARHTYDELQRAREAQIVQDVLQHLDLNRIADECLALLVEKARDHVAHGDA